MTPRVAAERLVLRPWSIDDTPTALTIYGDPEVARWLVPVTDRAPDEQSMRLVLQQWREAVSTPGQIATAQPRTVVRGLAYPDGTASGGGTTRTGWSENSRMCLLCVPTYGSPRAARADLPTITRSACH